jgi:Fe-S-cluster containining protein
VKTFWLSTHLDYACRHSGACCTARWPVPIERDRAAAVSRAIASGRVNAPLEWFRNAPGSPDDVSGVLAQQPSGACVFHRPGSHAGMGAPVAGGCAIHKWRPGACEHFPFVCVIDPRGVHVTLSHYCPTAAGLLFEDTDARVVEGPPALGDGRIPEGLDARESLPPADASGARLLSWEDVTGFESALVSRLSAATDVPDAPSLEQYERARSAVLPGWAWPEAPAAADAAWRKLAAPSWPRWSAVIGRYLSAKAHASWAMCLGDGFRAVERLVDLARVVLQVEAVRACVAGDAPLDRLRLTGAIRQSDLLLVHLADPHTLVDRRR